MSGLSVLAITLAPLGILSYAVIRQISAYNVNEVQVSNGKHLITIKALIFSPLYRVSFSINLIFLR